MRPASSTTDFFVQADVPIAVRDYGPAEGGPDVLLLHGAGRNLIDWDPVAHVLRDRYRLIAMDLRGHGLSGTGEWTWAAVLDDIEAVVDALGLASPAIVGHSLGGMLAAIWAAERDCISAVNLDGHGMGTPDLYQGIRADVVSERIAAITALNGASVPSREPLGQAEVDALIAGARAVAQRYGLPEQMAPEQIHRNLRDGEKGLHLVPHPDVMVQLLGAVESLDTMGLWRRARKPLLVVNATAADPLMAALPFDWAPELMDAYRRGLSAALHQAAQGHRYLEAQDFDGDHGLILNQPAKVAGLVDGFLHRWLN